MGKGDQKSKKGKITRGTSGVRRQKKKDVVEIVEKPKVVAKKKAAPKKEPAAKKAAPKKTVAKKPAAKKTAEKKAAPKE
jgi:ribosomal small subunit protein bTHX